MKLFDIFKIFDDFEKKKRKILGSVVMCLERDDTYNNCETLKLSFIDNLSFVFKLDLGNVYKILTKAEIDKYKIEMKELVAAAIKNFYYLCEHNHSKIDTIGNKVNLICTGKITQPYASLCCSMELLKMLFKDVVENDMVFCIPSKYLVAATDSNNQDGIKLLKEYANVKVGKNISEKEYLSDKLYIYKNNKVYLFNK